MDYVTLWYFIHFATLDSRTPRVGPGQAGPKSPRLAGQKQVPPIRNRRNLPNVGEKDGPTRRSHSYFVVINRELQNGIWERRSKLKKVGLSVHRKMKTDRK